MGEVKVDREILVCEDLPIKPMFTLNQQTEDALQPYDGVVQHHRAKYSMSFVLGDP